MVRARPANPTHSSWPSRVVTLPSRLILRVSIAAPPTSAVLLASVPGARACGCRYSRAHVVHVYCCAWSVCGGWRGRLRLCRVQPEHSVHTFSSTIGVCWQAAHPSHLARVADPGVPARFSAASARCHHWSCAPCTPSIFPCRAVVTMETRAVSALRRPVGSSSLRINLSLFTPAFATAMYDLLSHAWARRPTNTGSTSCAALLRPSARCRCSHRATRLRAAGNSLRSMSENAPTAPLPIACSMPDASKSDATE